MKSVLVILLLVGAGLAGYVAYSAKQKHVSVPDVRKIEPPKKTQWSPDEIAKDPQGYLVWSDGQIRQQIVEREKRLEQISTRRGEIIARQQQLVDKNHDVENFRTRLQQALQRAEDEDRWPIRMAGRTFQRDKAIEYINQTGLWLADRQPLTNAYADAIKKMDETALVLRGDLRRIAQLREKLALDLDNVKLNQGMADLDQLRRTESQLASIGESLNKSSDAEAPALPVTKSDRIDIDAIIK